jgi:hypothetical protein
MATIDENVTNTISASALHMLDCFASGLDKLVYEIAKQIAIRRRANCPDADPHSPVEIAPEDVKEAGEFIAQFVEKLVADGTIPATVSEEVDRMVKCCQGQHWENR